MKNNLHLSIPQPCHEDWDKMALAEQGRFCNVCSKCVVDFTKFSDDELLAYFSKTTQNVCGRFDSRQLNKTITKTQVYSTWFNFPKKWMLAAGLWIGFMAKGMAQAATIDTIAKQEIIYRVTETQPANDTTRTLTGIVIDSSSNEALSGVMIVVVGTPLGAYTDANGRFSITLPKEYSVKTVSLQLQYVGYGTTLFTVKPDENHVILKIDGSDIIKVKEVVVTAELQREYITGNLPVYNRYDKIAVLKKRTRWQRIKDFFKELF